MDRYLRATEIIQSDHPDILVYVKQIVGEERDPIEIAKRLYIVVRDGIRYDPYTPFWLPEHYMATNVLKRKRGFCIPKAAVLCTLSRAAGIPCRLGFADVRNHLATQALLDHLGTDLFVFHGFVEFYLQGKWVKATPAFNKELCEKFHVSPLEFDGVNDSIFHMYNQEKRQFMEYIKFHGVYEDVPVAEIVKAFKEAYGEDRVSDWMKWMN